MAKIEPEPIEIRRAFNAGYELHWTNRPRGESLQGWYRLHEEAENALRQLVEMRIATAPGFTP